MSPRSGLVVGCGVVAALVVTMLGCERRAIPERRAAAPTRTDPTALLTGGTLVFSDAFDREQLGEDWTSARADWRIEGGMLHSTLTDNAGVWLNTPLPAGRVRVEFSARSDELPDGQPFPGDVKCEIFASAVEHQSGYVIINGGWQNRLDVIARLDEHGKDRGEQSAAVVEPGRSYRWAIVRDAETLTFFRDQALVMTYRDPEPLTGRYFGFNNWRTNVWFDDLAVYGLD